MAEKRKIRRKLLTVHDVQKEYLNMDARKLRAFLNSHCNYKRIGNTYYYSRTEVEDLLLAKEAIEFEISPY